MAALDRHRGAMLAYPVGSGKTWIALAVARARSTLPVMVLAPPPLLDHWERVAATLGVPIVTWSHARASRAAPPPAGGLVLIDESHHFRNPQTRRYAVIAPWLVGHEVLMLTATPVINRLGDLTAQLALGVRDDALAASGTGSLAAMLAGEAGHPALAELVIAPTQEAAATEIARPGEAVPDGDTLVSTIDALQLSPDAPVASLIRRVFWRAAASSPAALEQTVAAYERLLSHAADAAVAGCRVTRGDIRRFAGVDETQLVLWEMVAERGDAALSSSDLPALRNLRKLAAVACRRDDARVLELRALLEDDVPSLVFTCRRATVRYLRDRLAPTRVAWCTGDRAGVGPLAASRRRVFAAFRGDAAVHPLAPRHLITTDVAAEGLDLSRLSRVIHYDLPWTAARLVQREGRSRRGERAQFVTTHAISISPVLEARLGIVPMLERKRQLPHHIGLQGPSPWVRREQLVHALDRDDAVRGVAAVEGSAAALLLGLEVIDLDRERVAGRSAMLCRSIADFAGEPESLDMLAWAARCSDVVPPSREERRSALAWATAATRSMLRQHEAAAWWRRGDPIARALLGRLHDGVRQASRARDRARLAAIEHAMQVVARGHTAGERMLLQQVIATRGLDPVPLLASWPISEAGALLEVRLTGLVIIRDGSHPFPTSRETLPFPDSRHTFGAHEPL